MYLEKLERLTNLNERSTIFESNFYRILLDFELYGIKTKGKSFFLPLTCSSFNLLSQTYFPLTQTHLEILPTYFPKKPLNYRGRLILLSELYIQL